MTDNEEKKEPKSVLFKSIFSLTIITFLFNLLAFVIPLWIQRKEGTNNQFVSIGLWVSCFDGFMYYDLYNKAYYGCWYIFHKEYTAVKSWITPDWLYAVQVLSIIGFMCHLASLMIVSCQYVDMLTITKLSNQKLLIFLNILAGCCLFVALVAFGVESNDSRWMPNPGQNTLSWSYAFAAISFIVTLILLALYFYQYLELTVEEDIQVIGGPAKSHEASKSERVQQYDPRGVYHLDDADPGDNSTV